MYSKIIERLRENATNDWTSLKIITEHEFQDVAEKLSNGIVVTSEISEKFDTFLLKTKLIKEFVDHNINFDNNKDANYIDDSFNSVFECFVRVVQNYK